MPLYRGAMRAVPLVSGPDGSPAERPRGRALLAALAGTVLALFASVAPAAASEPEAADDATAVIAPADSPYAPKPAVRASLVACDLLGASDVAVRATGLKEGSRYVVGVSGAEGVLPYTPTEVVTAESNTAVFADLPNGGRYEVWLADSEGATLATDAVALPVCELPTLDDSAAEFPPAQAQPAPEAEQVLAAPAPAATELAATGWTDGGAAIAAALGLGAGILLVGMAALRRRTA